MVSKNQVGILERRLSLGPFSGVQRFWSYLHRPNEGGERKTIALRNRLHIALPPDTQTNDIIGASYYWKQLHIRAVRDHLHGIVGDITIKLLHIQKIFYPSAWYRELISMCLLDPSLNVKIS